MTDSATTSPNRALVTPSDGGVTAPAGDSDWTSGYALPRREKIITLAGSMLGLFLAALDQTVVSTAGPLIQRDLHIAPAVYPWLTTSYLVATTVMVPVFGKLSDQVGRRKTLLAGLLIFLAGSMLCGASWSTTSLVAFRAVQGFGAAALYTSGFSVIADLYPPAERGRYQGLFGAVFGISSLVGPLLGGVLTDKLSWHWIFFVNLPLGLLSLALVWNHMPAGHRRAPGERLHVDVWGALLLITSIAPLLFALSFGRSHVVAGEAGLLWGSPVIVGLFLLSVGSMAAFVVQERRHREPIVAFGMYSEPTFGIVSAGGFLVGIGFIAAPIFLPLFLVNVLHASATRAGLSMIPLTLGFVLGAMVGGQIGSRTGRVKPTMLVTLALLITGFLVMGNTLGSDSTPRTVALRMLLIGVAMGPTMPLYMMAIQNAVRAEQIGVATASLTFSRALGQVVGVAAMGTIFAAMIGAASGAPVEEGVSAIARLSSSPEGREAITRGVRTLFQVSAVSAAAALVATLFLPDLRLPARESRDVATAK